MKKGFFTILLLVAAISAHSQNYDFSAVCSTGQTLYYNITSDSTVTITYPNASGNSYYYGVIEPSGYLIIPEQVAYNGNSYKITNIGWGAFYNCSNISSLHIGGNIDTIGSAAFWGCSGIHKLDIPDNVERIEDYAFEGCSNIDSLYIGSGVTFIGYRAFYGCSELKYLHYNAKNCASGLFNYNNQYGSPISPFAGTSTPNFKELVIGDSVYSIPTNCFSNIGGVIDSIFIGKNVSSIGYSAFSGCSGVKYVYYNAKNCETGLFGAPFVYGNQIVATPSFTTLVIGDSVNVIPSDCFSYRNSIINTLVIPNGVIQIKSGAFRNCTGIDSLILSESVLQIEGGAFYGCSGIRTLLIPDNVNIIGPNAFYGCSGIDTLQIGTGLTRLEEGTFVNCTAIRNLFIPNHITYLGGSCFAGCSALETIYIGSGVEEISSSAFNGCGGIKRIYYNACNCNSKISAHWYKNGIWYYGALGNTNPPNFTTLIIGENVTTIPDSCFMDITTIDTLYFLAKKCMKMDSRTVLMGCNDINSIIVGDSVQRIPDYAFVKKSGTAFNSIPWGSSMHYIGAMSFANSQNISGNIFFPNTIDSVGIAAFQNCDNILSFSTNARYIGSNAFANCDRLISVTLGDSTQTLGDGVFSSCFRLQNIDLGGVTSIGDSAFYGCERLERPELPANLTTIGTRAFNNCNLLSGKLTFPATITSIGDYAYSGVGTITEIEMQGSNPPTIYANTFASASSSTPVSVPCGAVINYYTTNYWENFSTIVEAPPYKLTVETNNEVMGNAAVSQQPTCSNHSAIIQATAEAGFHFLQWNDGNGSNPRTIQMTQDSTFTAIFVPNNSYIIIEPNNPTMGSTTGTGTYSYNAPVTMTATAYDGYHFLKWNDGNTQNPRYMAAVRDTTFSAIFVSNVSTITVSNANPDWGNVSGSGVYYYQNLVSITATPVYGYHFAQWNDGNTLNPRTITVNQDSSFTAYFAVNTYSIVGASNSTAMGSVTGSGSYTYQHEMSLTATPAFGYHFVQWNDQNTDNPRTITVTRDSAFTAQFAANSYTITADANDPTMGSAYGSGTYNFNTTATLTAVAEYGYHFTQWSDGVTDNPRTVTVQNSATYTAQFEINSYIITVQSSNPAIGTTSGGGSYNYLTPVNITANSNAGYHFTQWSDGNTDNPRLISVTQNATYVAQFAINSYAVGVVSGNTSMGSVSGSGTYNHNATATLTATAFYGYHFVQWSDGNTDNPRSVVVTDSAQYTAEFTFNSYLVIGNSSNVTLGSVTGGGSYNYLSQVALTAVPVPHYHFTMWNDSIEDNPRTITVTRDTTLTAHFAIDRHTIGVNTADATQGTVSGTDTVNYNTAVWISATANYGYHFTQWNDGNTSNPRRVVVQQDTVFTASFAPNQYSATCAVNDNTRGSVTTTGGNYNYLTQLTFTAVPNANYHFLRWSNGSTDNPITFTLTKDTTLTAILVGLTAHVNDNTMGMVSHTKPSNLVEVVTATPNYGYHFVQWNDGNTDNPRTINLVGDTSVTAVFAINTYVVSVVSNDSTLGTVQGGGEYIYLSQVTITATAAQHSHFVQWNDGNTTNPRLVTLTRDTTFTAIFEADQQYQITVNANDTTIGSVTGSGMYYNGETVTITATANDHYYFSQWSDGNTSNPRLVTVSGEATYTAVFEPVMYTVTVTANDYSMGQVTGGGSYAYGTSVTLEARAFEDYRFVRWSDGDTAVVRTVTVTDDIQLEATFERKNPDGIDDVEGKAYKVYVQQRHIVIGGLENYPNAQVMVFDITGRRHSLSEALSTGVYLVKIGGWTKKVVVL